MKFITTNYKEVSVQTFKQFKNIKVIVFDFDDTLYKYLSWEGYDEFFINSVRKLFPEFTDEEYNYYLKKYDMINSCRVSEHAAVMLLDLHGSTKELVKMLKEVEYKCNWEEGKIFPQEILKELYKDYKMYIVSNSAKNNIKYVSKNMGINLKYFADILPNNFEKTDLSKTARLKEIIAKEKLPPQQILMVGDSAEYDLIPARKLGVKTLLIED